VRNLDRANPLLAATRPATRHLGSSSSHAWSLPSVEDKGVAVLTKLVDLPIEVVSTVLSRYWCALAGVTGVLILSGF
jgi:hypothetical protein